LPTSFEIYVSLPTFCFASFAVCSIALASQFCGDRIANFWKFYFHGGSELSMQNLITNNKKEQIPSDKIMF